MKKVKLKMGLSNLSTSDFLIRCSAIGNAMAQNATTFPNPQPTLPELNQAIGDLILRQEAVEQKQGPDATRRRNEARQTLHGMMVQLATYVSVVANGNADIIMLSGFSIAKDGTSVGVLPPPNDIKSMTDNLGLGTIRLYWKGVDRSRGYIVSIAMVMADGSIGEWTTYKAKRLSYTFAQLVSGQLYAMRVATLSAEGQGHWSITITYRPQ